MQANDIIAHALSQPKDAIFNTLSRILADQYPDRGLIETEDGAFDLYTFIYEGQCKGKNIEGVHSQWSWGWDHFERQAWTNPYHVWFDIEWEGHRLESIHVEIYGSHCRESRSYILAESEEIARRFHEAVCEWCSEIRGEILVFAEGSWSKSASLFESIQSTKLDDLILAGSLKEEIVGNFRQFFEAKETYHRYGIPWKRGVLLLGPPGNGKTHAIKGLVNELGLPCLYVQSFSAEYMSDQHNIANAFKRARASAPCLFVLEDLDSLLTDENRSFFLNELDGFSANEGLLTIATTNHPERLDPAIMERPSRFDRKYHFNLPAVEERARYLDVFGSRFDPQLRLSKQGLKQVAVATEGFSFAYLKELYLSAMMEWIALPEKHTMAELMSAQADVLLEQMRTSHEQLEAAPFDGEENPLVKIPKAYRRQYQRMMSMKSRGRR